MNPEPCCSNRAPVLLSPPSHLALRAEETAAPPVPAARWCPLGRRVGLRAHLEAVTSERAALCASTLCHNNGGAVSGGFFFSHLSVIFFFFFGGGGVDVSTNTRFFIVMIRPGSCVCLAQCDPDDRKCQLGFLQQVNCVLKGHNSKMYCAGR